MPIYVVERRMAIGNFVVAGKLGPDLCDLEKLALSCVSGVPVDPDLADYIGRVRHNIPNPRFGSRSIHYKDLEFGAFGIRFYKGDALSIWAIATLQTSTPLSQKTISIRSNLPDEGTILHQEEINKPPVGMIFRYHPSVNMTGRRIIMNNILSR